MTIHERMVARSEREKDLLKFGRSQERERIIKLLEAWSCGLDDCPEWRVNSEKVIEFCNTRNSLIALIKGEM